jgi:hypothetical protein
MRGDISGNFAFCQEIAENGDHATKSRWFGHKSWLFSTNYLPVI